MKTRTIKMKKGSTAQSLFDECKKLFLSFSSINFSKIISDRNTDKAYSISFQDNVEADEEHKNKSANDLKSENAVCITLEERLQMEIDYFKETGNHLDIENITLCSGSRYQDGGVPSVGWGRAGGGMYVRWCGPDDRDGGLRTRVAVSSKNNK